MNGLWPVLGGLVQLGWETSCWSEEENEEEGEEDEEEEEIEWKCGIVSFESILGRHSRRETTVGKDDSMGIIGNSDILENCHRTLGFFLVLYNLNISHMTLRHGRWVFFLVHHLTCFSLRMSNLCVMEWFLIKIVVNPCYAQKPTYLWYKLK